MTVEKIDRPSNVPSPPKLKVVAELFDFAFKMKFHQFSQRHPDKSESEIKAMALESIERGCQ